VGGGSASEGDPTVPEMEMMMMMRTRAGRIDWRVERGELLVLAIRLLRLLLLLLLIKLLSLSIEPSVASVSSSGWSS
jgi:hypothetical protein